MSKNKIDAPRCPSCKTVLVSGTQCMNAKCPMVAVGSLARMTTMRNGFSGTTRGGFDPLMIARNNRLLSAVQPSNETAKMVAEAKRKYWRKMSSITTPTTT